MEQYLGHMYSTVILNTVKGSIISILCLSYRIFFILEF